MSTPVLIFDGDCGFCTRSARWIEVRLDDANVTSYQSIDIDEYGLSLDDVVTAAYWVDEQGTTHRGHLAIGRSLIAVGGAWSIVGWLLVTPPISWVAKPVYGLVARNRSKLPGATDACELPR
jgi:predicted DCC family thiol-disulfide oxidoreductase YuxK